MRLSDHFFVALLISQMINATTSTTAMMPVHTPALNIPPITSQEEREMQSSIASVRMYVYFFIIAFDWWMQFLCQRFLIFGL
jgi:hypothetical protein